MERTAEKQNERAAVTNLIENMVQSKFIHEDLHGRYLSNLQTVGASYPDPDRQAAEARAADQDRPLHGRRRHVPLQQGLQGLVPALLLAHGPQTRPELQDTNYGGVLQRPAHLENELLRHQQEPQHRLLRKLQERLRKNRKRKPM